MEIKYFLMHLLGLRAWGYMRLKNCEEAGRNTLLYYSDKSELRVLRTCTRMYAEV